MDTKLIEEYRNTKKVKHNNYIEKNISKFLLSIIFLMLSIILIKKNSAVKEYFNDEVFSNNINFSKFNNFYNKYFGEVIPTTIKTTEAVFNETLEYEEVNEFDNYTEFQVSTNYMVPTLSSGIIVFLGDKDNFNNTCIIQGVDGIDIWYSNINISNLTLYDYVEKGSLLSLTLSDKLYITFKKEDNKLTYEEYQNRS